MTADDGHAGGSTRSWPINTKRASWRLTVTDEAITIDRKNGTHWITWPRSGLSRAYVSKLPGTVPRRDGIVLEFLVHSLEYEDDVPVPAEDDALVRYSYWVPILGGLWSSSEQAHDIAGYLTRG